MCVPVCPCAQEFGGGGQSPCLAFPVPRSAKPTPCFMLWGWGAVPPSCRCGGVCSPPSRLRGMGWAALSPCCMVWGWATLPPCCILWGVGSPPSMLNGVGVESSPSLLHGVGVGSPPFLLHGVGGSHPSLLCAVGVGSPPATSRFGNQAKNYA